MAMPKWLLITMSVLVMLYAGYRMYLAVGGPTNEERAKHRRGLLAMSRRSHGLVSVLLLIAGATLLAAAFGYSPWGARTVTAPTDPPGPGTSIEVR